MLSFEGAQRNGIIRGGRRTHFYGRWEILDSIQTLREMTLPEGREVIITGAGVLGAVTRWGDTQRGKESAFVAGGGESSSGGISGREQMPV